MIKEAASVPLIKYYSVDKSRRMGWVRFWTYGKERGACRVLARKPKENRPLWRHMRVWEDNTKMRIQQAIWRTGLDWFGSGRYRWRAFVNVVMICQFP
jgi:hypothetical protein